MEITIHGPDGREHSLARGPLEISYDERADVFSAVSAGHDRLAANPTAQALFVRTLRFLIGPDDTIVGFQILEFRKFDPEEGNVDVLYTPRFSAPELGLDDAPAGEIIEAVQTRLLS